MINVGTGVRLGDAFYSSAETSAYVAGLIAGQRLNQSTTYAATPFDDVTRRWTRAEQEQAVQNGVFIFFHDGRQVKALRGVNTLVTPAAGQNNAWKKSDLFVCWTPLTRICNVPRKIRISVK